MREMWRVIDTGLRAAAQNIALNRALLEARQAEEIPSTLRFLRFAPSALLGYHQSAEQEFNLDYCRANQIAVQRRITGGGAIFIDETQLGWELYLHRRDVDTSGIQAIDRRICHAAATAISALGVDARYRPRHDIEVDGRKISGTGGAFDGDALLYQGTLSIDFDVEKMLRVLRIPAEKLSDKVFATARERVANLTDLLGRRPDPDLVKRNKGRGYKAMQIYRTDCADSARVELRVSPKDGKAMCVYGGAASSKLDSDVDYLMWAETSRWLEMGKGEYGPMRAMFFSRLRFDGPMGEAMGNMGPFESFLRLVGKVPGDISVCPGGPAK